MTRLLEGLGWIPSCILPITFQFKDMTHMDSTYFLKQVVHCIGVGRIGLS